MRRLISGAAALLLLLPLSAVAGTAEADQHRAAPAKVVTYNGWGKLRLGMTDRQTWRTGMVSHTQSACAPGYTMKPAYAERGSIWWRDLRPKPFRVQKILIRGTKDRTAKGAGVGTTLRELRTLYPHLSRLTQASALDNQPGRDKKDLWIASASTKSGSMNFQFAYGARPKTGAKVEMIVVAREPAVFWGC